VITAGEEGIRGGIPPADVKITAVSSTGDATPMEQQHRVSPLHRSPRRNLILLLLCLPTITSGRTRYLYTTINDSRKMPFRLHTNPHYAHNSNNNIIHPGNWGSVRVSPAESMIIIIIITIKIILPTKYNII